MSETATLGWGVLGAGRILRKFGGAFRIARGVQLVAIASRDLARAQAAAAEWGAVRAHGSYDALLADPEVDIVINALHNGLHCEWTVRALEAGKHVLCEKPLACSTVEVERMFAAARANRRWLMEGFMYRFHPQIVEAQRRISAGEIGRVVYLSARYTRPPLEPDNPRYWRDAGGGALMDIGCYCVNAVRLFAGREPVRVTAHAHCDAASGVDVTLAGALEFSGGLTAHIACSFEAAYSFGVEIVGTDGKIVISDPWLPPAWPASLQLTRGANVELIRIEDATAPQHFLAPFALELEHFGAGVRANRAPIFPPAADAEQDARANMRALEMLLAAAGQSV